MDQQTLANYLLLLDAAKTAPEYRRLCASCAELDAPVQALLDRLPEPDCELLMDYIGVIGAVSIKLAQIACRR